MNLEDVEDSVEKQPSLVGSLEKKNSRIAWGKVGKAQAVTLKGGKGTCKEEKEGHGFSDLPLLRDFHPFSCVFHS